MTLQSDERKAVVDYRLEKARTTFNEAQFNFNGENYNLAVNRLYYTLFYAVTALLTHNKINSITHVGAKSMLHAHFVKEGILSKEDGALYNRLLQMRSSGDYDDFFDYSKTDVEPLFPSVKELIDKITSLIKEG